VVTNTPNEPGGPRLTGLGRIIIIVFIAACAAGAYQFLVRAPRDAGSSGNSGSGSGSGSAPAPGAAASPAATGDRVTLGIAYGTEKQRWLQWAVQEFANTPEGQRIQVDLIPLGSIEAAQHILESDKRISVWSPASAAYEDVFVQEWQSKFNSNPIVKKEALALTPMVFVIWDERYEAFARKLKTVSFQTIAQALRERGGWDAIAGKPEWGVFKFGHTHPNQSNSGLQTLVLAAHAYHQKTRGLTMKDILDVDFQQWLEAMERGVTGMSNSTGNMMRDMVLKGPSSYDAVFVYESVAIDFLKNAEGRWGKIRLVYPEYNAWNESPYYILNASWVGPAQRQAAEAFLQFLMSERVQKEALTHGFRPGDPKVPVKFSNSPFVTYAPYGVQVDLQKVCEPPKSDVVTNLLASWQRMQAGR
jgi:ABC-type glycerol-3-phosphate transport system substrate-binding protein